MSSDFKIPKGNLINSSVLIAPSFRTGIIKIKKSRALAQNKWAAALLKKISFITALKGSAIDIKHLAY